MDAAEIYDMVIEELYVLLFLHVEIDFKAHQMLKGLYLKPV